MTLLTRLEVSCSLCFLLFLAGGKVIMQSVGLYHHDYHSDATLIVVVGIWSFFLLRLRTVRAVSRGYLSRSEWVSFLLFSASLGTVFAVGSVAVGN
jgi:hypothetical protein